MILFSESTAIPLGVENSPLPVPSLPNMCISSPLLVYMNRQITHWLLEYSV